MVKTLQMLAAQGTELTFGDSLKVTAIGVVTVFAVLVMLIVLIEVLHAILKDRKTADNPSQSKPAEAKPAVAKPEKRISAGVMAEVPDVPEAEKDTEFIAAISAAITCVTGNADFKIKSIKKG